jgi:hypothetical protein
MSVPSTRGRPVGRVVAYTTIALLAGGSLSCVPTSVVGVRDGSVSKPLSSATGKKKPSRDLVLNSALGTYIGRILEDRDSVLDRWPDRVADPIRVWIDEAPPAKMDPATFANIVRDAFDEWTALGIPIRFIAAASARGAEVRVHWVESLPNKTGSTTWRSNRDGWLQAGDITLATHMSTGTELDARGLKAIALHEIGHVLGLSHSADARDVMAPLVRVADLSAVDCATIRLLYTFPAGRIR